MREVLTLPAAEADLDAIAIYTKEQWGPQQAKRYLAGLRADIEALARFPLRYPEYANRHGKFRKMNSGHHCVFYQFGEEIVTVARVLHERMDFDDLLA